MVDVVVLGERLLRVCAVDGARRRENQMLDAEVTGGFEDVEKAAQVRLDVDVRIDQRVAHAGLRGEMHDARRLVRLEDLAQPLIVGNIRPQKAEILPLPENRQPRFLERDVVIVIEVVDGDDLVPAVEQPFGDVKSDEAGRAGHRDPLRRAGSAPFGVHPARGGCVSRRHQSIFELRVLRCFYRASRPLSRSSRLSRSISAWAASYSSIFRRRKARVTATFSSRPFGVRVYAYASFFLALLKLRTFSKPFSMRARRQ